MMKKYLSVIHWICVWYSDTKKKWWHYFDDGVFFNLTWSLHYKDTLFSVCCCLIWVPSHYALIQKLEKNEIALPLPIDHDHLEWILAINLICILSYLRAHLTCILFGVHLVLLCTMPYTGWKLCPDCQILKFAYFCLYLLNCVIKIAS